MRGAKIAAATSIAIACCVAVLGAALTGGGAAAAGKATTSDPDVYVRYSTQAVCALTGNHGAYTELPVRATDTAAGLIAGDAGASFVFDGAVWWLFGNSNPSVQAPWGSNNDSSRWPTALGPPFDAVALGSDAMASSSLAAKPPAPVAPYNNTEMPPNQQCPTLNFVPKSSLPPSAYANPSVYPDPMFKTHYFVSLRTGELPETGISEGHPAGMYVVFGTDNAANCETLTAKGPCTDPTPPGSATTCSGAQKGSRTRSVMAVYDGSEGRFKGLYDLSAPVHRFGPLCPVAPSGDPAKFVNVQMAKGNGGWLYLWGTEGGANNGRSPVYLARMPAQLIASGAGLEYWDSTHFVPAQSKATPLWNDRPSTCASQLGVQYNAFLKRWIVLYHCKEPIVVAGHPNGIFMRTAVNPWGPWSTATTIFLPNANPMTKSGYCFFIYSTQTQSAKNPTGSSTCRPSWPNASLADGMKHVGDYYGPYFVANWTTGTMQTATQRATTTIYYTLDTFDPYGQLIMRSTILGPLPPKPKV